MIISFTHVNSVSFPSASKYLNNIALMNTSVLRLNPYDMLELHEGGHSGPIRTLRASPPSCAKSLALSCSSTEVHLWDVSAMDHGAAHVFEVGGAVRPELVSRVF